MVLDNHVVKPHRPGVVVTELVCVPPPTCYNDQEQATNNRPKNTRKRIPA